MKKDEILSMAKQAGIDAWWESGSEWRETFDEHIERFAALVAEKEREECAKVCDPYTHGQWFAAAIRARSKDKK